MQALVLSDLHFEFHRDLGRSFVDGLPTNGVDVVVLAGDISVGRGIESALSLFCTRYPQVVYVHGNHEFYRAPREEVVRATRRATRTHRNLHWLDCSEIELSGVHFVGAPLWFRQGAPSHKQYMADFHVIPDFEAWVYDENARAVDFFARTIRRGSVVVTHHLPSPRSVAAQFVGSSLNAFFVCDVEALIEETKPGVWIHGHTHSSLDYRLGHTRIVCNPFGYARQEENAHFSETKLVDLSTDRG